MICIVIIASVGVILYLQRKGKEPKILSYQKLCADFDVETWKFRSFTDGEIVCIKDNVLAVNCTDTLFGTYTHVTFSSMSYSESSFSVPSIPPLSIHLVGNLTEEYSANEEVEIQSHVRTYTIGEKTATILEEWYVYFLCAYYSCSIRLKRK
ncbi:MAG: hypothetical protein QMD21_00505 [Candidatus Thermoplasmatota archaeon]|nr:hypothetical protein [Candidatus Thermoplasmatota archaeon]